MPLNVIRFLWFYCILIFNCTVLNATLSPKSSMATPGWTKSSRGHRTLSTRLPMVSLSRASESLVGAWANSCRVRGRLSLLMMARPKSSKACSIWSISREQVGHGTSTVPYASNKKLFHCNSHIWSNVAECCFRKLFIGVEGRDFPECAATWRRWRFHPEPPMTCFLLLWIPTHTTIEQPSHRAGSWIQ